MKKNRRTHAQIDIKTMTRYCDNEIESQKMADQFTSDAIRISHLYDENTLSGLHLMKCVHCYRCFYWHFMCILILNLILILFMSIRIRFQKTICIHSAQIEIKFYIFFTQKDKTDFDKVTD